MKLVKIDNDTIINVEKVLCIEGDPRCNFCSILLETDKKIRVQCSSYTVKKIIEDAMKEM